jgi:hypothetical protein
VWVPRPLGSRTRPDSWRAPLRRSRCLPRRPGHRRGRCQCASRYSRVRSSHQLFLEVHRRRRVVGLEGGFGAHDLVGAALCSQRPGGIDRTGLPATS